ncbi:hypothetical protein B0H10DRAFT_2040864 [Mycena sp. CBHHK59/15]|nr:hypothetical protein B0H10DRAFT_2040864 [Mycena sp. CBHHK59/15]
MSSETQPDLPVKAEPGADPAIPPPSDYDTLMTRLQEKSHDPEGWKRLVDVAENSGDITHIRQTYDALLKQYPNTAAAQTAYISHFLDNPATFGDAEELLNKFLRTSPSVELWKFYLTYVRRVNAGPATRETVRKAYEFALNHVGQDRESGSIWAEYIQFLNAAEATTTWETQQKMDALRKVYHRAVQIPLENVERLWFDLEAFETGLSRITAKKFMEDLSPAHMQARTVLRQLSGHLQGLGLTTGTLFLPSLPTFSPLERNLVGRWKAYLKWEEGNPLEIDDKDRPALISRVQGVYRKAVIRMRYYPEIWFMAYTWTTSIGKNDEALSILKAGLEANPASFLLTFAYAELLETKKEFTEVHTLFERFFSVLRVDLAVLSANATTTADPPAPAPIDNDSPPKPSNDELVERKKEYSLAWIDYMRFARRAEGVKASREVFARARKDEWVGWEVYEAAAIREYHCDSDGRAVATRIFETGMRNFGTDVDFVLRYLGFLLSVNDENNARALFERVIGTFTPQQAKPLWERWSRYEYQYGDFEAVLKIERRMAEIYPNDAPIKRFAQRHTYLNIDAIADRDLGFAKARKQAVATPVARTETQLSVLSNSNANTNGNGNGNGSLVLSNTNKRPPSPPDRKRENDYKRARPAERDRDRRRYSPPPTWERERDVKPPPPRRDKEPPREKEEKPVMLPSVLSWFMTQLPPPAAFDGPVFNTDNLMDKLRNAVIPSTSARVRSPPPPPRSGGGRPPPDYGPYQGPGSTPRGGGRRY